MGSGQNGQLTGDSTVHTPYTQGAYSTLDDPQVIDPAMLDLSRSRTGNLDIDPQLLDARGDHDSAGTGIEAISHWPENYLPPNEIPGVHSEVLGGFSGDLQVDGGNKAGRGLPRRRSRYLTRNSAAAGPVVIPNASSLDPMERWRNSPPEEEPALIPDIIDALKTTPEPGKPNGSRGNNAFRDYRRAASTTSGESSASSRDSQQSGRSSSSGRGRLRAGKNTRKKLSNTNALRRYCCTFCCDRFKSKYDWARHEKSLHVTLEAWYCAPFGTTIPSNALGETLCAFCGITNPTQAHIETHEPTACEASSPPETRRSFRRKDHLVQHLRRAHNVPATSTPPDLESWKIGHSSIPSRCGFCNKSLSTWAERTEHLAEHFRHGQTMSSWTGEHDFPPLLHSPRRKRFTAVPDRLGITQLHPLLRNELRRAGPLCADLVAGPRACSGPGGGECNRCAADIKRSLAIAVTIARHCAGCCAGTAELVYAGADAASEPVCAGADPGPRGRGAE